jgi:putative ABC transport system substrate-binding protein
MRASVALALLLAVGAAAAQPSAKVWRLATLSNDRARGVEVMLQTLANMSYVEGKNLVVERREFRTSEELAARAAELARLKPDVIVVGHGAAALAMKSVTKTVPIVMAGSNDAVAQGIVATLARPGGNVTGLTNMSPEISSKRLEILKELAPRASRIALVGCPQMGAGGKGNLSAVLPAAQRIGVQLVPVYIERAEDLPRAFEAAMRQKIDGVMVLDCAFYGDFGSVTAMVNQSRLPAVYPGTRWVRDGGLLSYGPSGNEQWRHAAMYVDKIFKGAKPADLPVEQPTKFELVVNLETAKAQGASIPPSLLHRATQVIH